MRLIEIKREDEMILPYHGIAFYDYHSNRTITAVVPLNWVISIGLSVWSFLRFGNKTMAFSPRDAYRQGYRHGMQDSVNKKD